MLLERGGIMQNLVAVAGNGLLDRRAFLRGGAALAAADRKSTRLNSSHSQISYAVFCLKKKKRTLLRIIAGITKPTTGSVAIKARGASLLQLRAGFYGQIRAPDNGIQMPYLRCLRIIDA